VAKKPKFATIPDPIALAAKITRANTPKPKPELGGAIGHMTNGRFIGHQIQLRAKVHAYTDEMIDIVAELARNSTSDFCRLAAANSLIDRDLGRAVQFTETTIREERIIRPEVLTPEMRKSMVAILDALDPTRKLPDKS
jgi:uncharacterized protein (DUF1778 family)